MYNRRYYLHHRLKVLVRVNPKAKTIYLPTDYKTWFPVSQSKYLAELITEFGYVVQLTIPVPVEQTQRFKYLKPIPKILPV